MVIQVHDAKVPYESSELLDWIKTNSFPTIKNTLIFSHFFSWMEAVANKKSQG